MSKLHTTLPTSMQVSTLSYIWEPLCDDVQVHDMVSHSAIRQNCRRSHNTLYLHQPTLPPQGGQGPAPDANTNLLPPLNLRISKSVFIASPKDHTSDARRPVTRLHGVWDKQEPSEKDGIMVATHRPDQGNATQSTRLS